MKLFAVCTTAIATLCFPALIAASPLTVESPNPNSHTWSFKLFPSRHCKGVATTYQGRGSTGCRADIPKGVAAGYMSLGVDPKCTIALYRDATCSTGKKGIDLHKASQKCKRVKGIKHNMRSFEVTCS
ncbi:hypothetical protein N7468_000616 [Penicillium chermesinum]|uniref:Uncharacterized protein n=1 Tax=Penicillium chermesinum TaxID=63820 RepID=A0A9W9PKM3_9EURO|nr:uncharacterized protein N7468_000616 [Penicillium chermesinum]KAJ5249165.1 hypothetical protein N7468_000616 [Penicillium chermesinum]